MCRICDSAHARDRPVTESDPWIAENSVALTPMGAAEFGCESWTQDTRPTALKVSRRRRAASEVRHGEVASGAFRRSAIVPDHDFAVGSVREGRVSFGESSLEFGAAKLLLEKDHELHGAR